MSLTYGVIAAVVLFGLLGFQRGWLRELPTLAGLLIAWLIVLVGSGSIVDFVNRADLILQFNLKDGFDAASPGALIQELRRSPLVDPRHPGAFAGILFCVLAVIAFVAASRFAPPAAGAASRGLGALLGVANGYLVAYLGLRYLIPTGRVGPVIAAGPGSIVDLLGQYLPTLLLVGVVLAIAIALLSSRRLGPRSSLRAMSGRAKG